MFGKLKQYALKKVLQSQMKDAPPEQQKMILEMIEKDPSLFEKIAKEEKNSSLSKAMESLLSSHPIPEERLQAYSKRIAKNIRVFCDFCF